MLKAPVSDSLLHRIVLGIEYDGSLFHGWQKQSSPQLATVQSDVESALSRIADHPIKLTCAGRTDAGVHATGQVVHFDCAKDRGQKAWIRGSNSLLPSGIRILWARETDSGFHARFSALARRYRYIIYESEVEPALFTRQLTHFRGRLQDQLMDQAGRYLIGEHDFSAYRAAGCQSKTPFREILELSVRRKNDFVIIEIQANAFLQHMVRNIAGVLMLIGRGVKEVDWAHQVLLSEDRTKGAITARPEGLYLIDVRYPDKFALPRLNFGPMFINLD